jgi:hypothetical protein
VISPAGKLVGADVVEAGKFLVRVQASTARRRALDIANSLWVFVIVHSSRMERILFELS